MAGAHDHIVPDEPVSPDLVQYLIVVVPDVPALEGVVGALNDLVDARTIKILDVVVVSRDADGLVSASELDAVMPDAASAVASSQPGILSEHDIDLAAFEVPPGSTGLVVVTEDRWAAPLSHAAACVGGRIVAGERIPARRVETALADAPKTPKEETG